ncbi:hypothetical protein ACFV29_32565 [Streptomyces sp. NPDC059690]|uniref:hypothetical protein n=1 Tax=Streptomyces sp. NPDC059690 TaxID=3346907 RepID=UPI00368327F3
MTSQQAQLPSVLPSAVTSVAEVTSNGMPGTAAAGSSPPTPEHDMAGSIPETVALVVTAVNC